VFALRSRKDLAASSPQMEVGRTTDVRTVPSSASSGRRVDDVFANCFENQQKAFCPSDGTSHGLAGNLVAAQLHGPRTARDHRTGRGTGIRTGDGHIYKPTITVKGREQAAGNLQPPTWFSPIPPGARSA